MKPCLTASSSLFDYSITNYYSKLKFKSSDKPNIMPLGVHNAQWQPIKSLNLTAPPTTKHELTDEYRHILQTIYAASTYYQKFLQYLLTEKIYEEAYP